MPANLTDIASVDLVSSVLEQLPAGIAIAAVPSGRILYVNRRLEEIWRRPTVVMETVADYAAYRGFYADGRPVLAEDWAIARALRGGEPVEQEVEIERGDGT